MTTMQSGPSRSGPKGGNGKVESGAFPEGSGRVGRLGESLRDFIERTKNLPPLTWLVEGLVPSVGQVWIVAMGGSGKTWCGFVIARTAAQAGRDVFLVEEEHGERGLRDRLVNMAFPPDTTDRVRLWHRQGLKVGDADKFAQLVEEVRSADRPVVVFDCLAQVFAGKENEADDAARFNDALKALVTANTDALVIVLHHTSKGSERAEGPIAYAGRGSSAFFGAADLELRLRKAPSEKGTLRFDLEMTKARDFEESGPKRLTLTLGSGEVSIANIERPREAEKAAKVIEVLRESEEPLTKDAVTKLVKRRRDDVGKTIELLVSQGKLRREGKGYVAVPIDDPDAEVSP